MLACDDAGWAEACEWASADPVVVAQWPRPPAGPPPPHLLTAQTLGGVPDRPLTPRPPSAPPPAHLLESEARRHADSWIAAWRLAWGVDPSADDPACALGLGTNASQDEAVSRFQQLSDGFVVGAAFEHALSWLPSEASLMFAWELAWNDWKELTAALNLIHPDWDDRSLTPTATSAPGPRASQDGDWAGGNEEGAGNADELWVALEALRAELGAEGIAPTSASEAPSSNAEAASVAAGVSGSRDPAAGASNDPASLETALDALRSSLLPGPAAPHKRPAAGGEDANAPGGKRLRPVARPVAPAVVAAGGA